MKRSLRSWLWRVPIDQEVDEELAFHAEMRRREGKPLHPDELARVKLAMVDLARKRDREMRLTQWLEELGGDVRFAIRQLRSSPGFTFVAALTLALGIGANSAMFGLVDATLLRPLPFPAAERLMLVEERSANHQGTLRSRIALLNFRDWSEQNRTFEMMAAAYVPPGGGGPTVTGADGTPEIVPNQTVTARFFDVFGIKPILGRTFVPADEAGDAAVVVLSEAFWRTHFGADPTILGRAIPFDGQPRTVVGIVPADFQFFRASGMWTLYPIPNNERGRRPSAGLRVIARLKPGIAVEAARTELNAMADAFAQQSGDTREARRVTVEPFRNELIGPELRLTSMLFLGVVGFVLLMCCANVANLLLARASARTRELAVRAALGAGRRRIVRQLLTESLVLATLGGAMGAGVGALILRAAPRMIPVGLLPGGVTLAFDARLVAFCAVTSIVVGVLFGLAPAWHATGGALVQAMSFDGRTSTGRGGRFRSVLVVVQTAAAVLLLCGAGLLLRTLIVVEGFEPGIRAQSDALLTMDFTVTRSAAPGGSRFRTEESWLRFYDAVQQEIAAVPGVQGVAWATTLPMASSQTGATAFEIAGDVPLPDSSRPRANLQIVSPTYFRTVDLPIVSGRGFTDRDDMTGSQVCIVSEAFVRRHLQGRNPIGSRVRISRFSSSGLVEREIVGVARQVKERPDETEELVQVYVPNAQDAWAEAYLIVRAPAESIGPLTPSIRAAIARVDKDMPVRRVRTLDAAAVESTERYRFRAALVLTFAGLALLLAMVGVFGVLAYSVQQRRREFGLRIALGATAADVLGLVMAGAGRVIGIGLVIGLVAAAAMARSIAAFLFGVQPLDPITFASVAGVLGVTAALAVAAPAFRATRVDPAVVFRDE